MTPQEFAAKLTDIVTNDRAKTHGDMHKVHRDIATLWNVYLSMRRHAEQPLLPTDVATMMALMKIARSQNGGGGSHQNRLIPTNPCLVDPQPLPAICVM